jgi:hypothetical protein
MKYWMKLIIGALILQVLAIGFAMILWFIKLMPALERITDIAP